MPRSMSSMSTNWPATSTCLSPALMTRLTASHPTHSLLGVGSAPVGTIVIIGSRPTAVFGADSSFTVDPRHVLGSMLEIHGSRYVTLTEIAQTLELLRQRRIRAIVSRTFPLEGAEEGHELLRKNALVGRAALVLES